MIPIMTNSVCISSNYGTRQYMYKGKPVKDFHTGIDLVPNNRTGNEEIIAFADGVVTSVQKIGKQYGTACYVRIKHSNGLYTVYYHLKSNSICVNVGDHVKKGQKIGIIGTTGISTGIHLHFQIDKGNSNNSINPYDYLFNNKEFIVNEVKDDLSKYTDEELARKVIRGDYGNGQERRNKLGSRFDNVQSIVNNILNNDKKQEPNVDLLLMVKKTIRGDYGNGKRRREILGEQYDQVMYHVNLNLRDNRTKWDNIKLY